MDQFVSECTIGNLRPNRYTCILLRSNCTLWEKLTQIHVETCDSCFIPLSTLLKLHRLGDYLLDVYGCRRHGALIKVLKNRLAV